MANSVDPDLGAVSSGSALFAQAYLSENLGSLRVCSIIEKCVQPKDNFVVIVCFHRHFITIVHSLQEVIERDFISSSSLWK